MTYSIFVERNGVRETFRGTDDDLDSYGSFVVQSGERQAVAKWQSNGTWRAWERLPVDRAGLLDVAERGELLGEARRQNDFPRLWSAYQRMDGTDAIADRPSPYGVESLGAAVNELLRLAKPAT